MLTTTERRSQANTSTDYRVYYLFETRKKVGSNTINSNQISRASHSDFVDTIYSEMLRYSIENIYTDASSPGFISDIKDRIGERTYEIVKDVKENQSNT